MSLLCSFQCFDVVFDVFSIERVPIGLTQNQYYVTPKLLATIEAWMIRNDISKIDSSNTIHALIDMGMIKKYVSI
jgi:hypothetical protein